MSIVSSQQGPISRHHMASRDVVTGAFGYIGRYVTARLLGQGHGVVTLTGHPERPSPFGAQVQASPFRFDDPAVLAGALRGAQTLYSTYWIRFARGGMTFDQAVENSRALIRAAEDAGIERIVHVSITNPSPDSPLPYFRGKALVEEAIMRSRLGYAILRPTVVFGREDILLNNIAWLLRRFPLFIVPGSGEYRVQPVFVEDLADLMIAAGQGRDNTVKDAAGPEVLTFNELVRLLRKHVGRRTPILHAPPAIPLAMGHLLGVALHDVVLTPDEVRGLAGNLLVSSAPPTTATRLSDWLARDDVHLGSRYASEIRRHYGRESRR